MVAFAALGDTVLREQSIASYYGCVQSENRINQ